MLLQCMSYEVCKNDYINKVIIFYVGESKLYYFVKIMKLLGTSRRHGFIPCNANFETM